MLSKEYRLETRVIRIRVFHSRAKVSEVLMRMSPDCRLNFS